MPPMRFSPSLVAISSKAATSSASHCRKLQRLALSGSGVLAKSKGNVFGHCEAGQEEAGKIP